MLPSPNRKPLHARSDSQTNIDTRAAIRLVPQTPPRLLLSNNVGNVSNVSNHRNNAPLPLSSRSPFPTLPAHVLSPPAADAPFQGPGYALKPPADVSAAPSVPFYPTKQVASPPGSSSGSGTTQHTQHTPPHSGQSTTPRRDSWASKPLPKRKKQLRINPDKTFSVLSVWDPTQPDPGPSSDGRLLSSSSRASQVSYDQPSSYTQDTADPIRSPSSCAPDSTAATTPTTPGPIIYKLVGGLRKVAKTPDLKQTASLIDSPTPPLLSETGAEDSKPTHELATKFSFHSTLTTSTTSENTNYKVYGASPSPAYQPSTSSDSNDQTLDSSSQEFLPDTFPFPPPPSTSDSNYQILSHSSPPLHPANNNPDLPPPSSSNSNYQVLLDQVLVDSSEVNLPYRDYEPHGDSSPSASYASLTSPRQGQYGYSRESLVVPPLHPRAPRSVERFGYYKQRSRETLRSGSLTSIGSVLSQEAAQAIAASAVVTSGSVIRIPSPKQKTASGSWAGSLGPDSARPMQAHPHQWSSQLSTVASVSDGGTDRGSRSWSDGNGRMSNGFPSNHSRHISSVSSSFLEEQHHIESPILERPQPPFARNRDGTGSTIRMVEDQDEYGDGITDMPELRGRPSRRNLSGFYSIASSDNGRTNTMKSASSSRANSLMSSSIPTWARLYYGSGERRYLGAPGSSTEGTDSRPQSSFRSGSPDTTNFPLSIYSPRRRPRDLVPYPRDGDRHSLEISPIPQLGGDGFLIHNMFAQRFRRTSSIWSPHLARDTRNAGKSIWEAPSITFSTAGKRRNVQVVMFIGGFIMPLAWIVAAFLPLPPRPVDQMQAWDHTNSNLDLEQDMDRKFGPMDERKHDSAKWWRALNRIMAVAGLAIIILTVSSSTAHPPV